MRITHINFCDLGGAARSQIPRCEEAAVPRGGGKLETRRLRIRYFRSRGRLSLAAAPLTADGCACKLFIAELALPYDDGGADYFGTRTGRWHVAPFETDRLLHPNYIQASALYRRSVWEWNRGHDGTTWYALDDICEHSGSRRSRD